ncbi:MAG: DUF2490 domain-containing protein [Candidatus Omnitrophica bacterium]|nr:DUF2490 domain-containing protein [Candidatus Omnitrophota bacterium]
MNIRKFMVVFILFFSAGYVYAGDDFQSWNQLSLKVYQMDKIDFIIFTDTRLTHDAQKLGMYFISPRVVYHHTKNLDFALNYTYLQSRRTSSSAIDDSYNWQHRAEIEVNPQWQLADWLKLKMRNRVEFRWIEGLGSDNTRYRQRWALEFPIKIIKPLKSLYASSEVFYDFSKSRINENRTVPVGLNFKMNDKVGLSLYYMIQSQKGTRDWASNQILGTLVSIDF